jgi:hypothetical protein
VDGVRTAADLWRAWDGRAEPLLAATMRRRASRPSEGGMGGTDWMAPATAACHGRLGTPAWTAGDGGTMPLAARTAALRVGQDGPHLGVWT